MEQKGKEITSQATAEINANKKTPRIIRDPLFSQNNVSSIQQTTESRGKTDGKFLQHNISGNTQDSLFFGNTSENLGCFKNVVRVETYNNLTKVKKTAGSDWKNNSSLTLQDQNFSMNQKPSFSVLSMIKKIDSSSLNIDDFDLETHISLAQPFQIIQLPAAEISIRNLLIDKPLTLCGQPGTTISIFESINLKIKAQYLNQHSKIVFKEIKFCVQNQDKNNKSIFTISSSSHVYFEDCTIESLTIKKLKQEKYFKTLDKLRQVMNADPNINEISDIADEEFSIDHLTENLFEVLKDPLYSVGNYSESGMLSIKSSLIQGFNNLCKCNVYYNFYFQDSSFEGVASGTYLADFGDLNIIRCVFSKSKKNGLTLSLNNLHFSKTAKIQIMQCTFVENDLNGLMLVGDNYYQSAELTIEKCNFEKNGKIGLSLNNINLFKLSILKCDIKYNKSYGISLENVKGNGSQSMPFISENRIFKNINNAGIYLCDSMALVHSNQILMNLLGIKIYSSKVESNEKTSMSEEEVENLMTHPLRMNFTQNHIYSNQEQGVLINTKIRGPILFKDCELSSNGIGIEITDLKYDCLLPCNFREDETLNVKFQNLGSITFRDCKITKNIHTGLTINNLENFLHSYDTCITDNHDAAIHIRTKEMINFLRIINKDSKKWDYNIQGEIKGPWGKLDVQESFKNKQKNCNIF